jgi:hypothetical protein
MTQQNQKVDGWKIIYKRKRRRVNRSKRVRNEQPILDWSKGASESTLFAVLTFFTFGIFVVLARPEILTFSAIAIIYTILLAFAILSNVDALKNFRTTPHIFTQGLVWGLAAWLILQMAGLVVNVAGLTLLEIPIIFPLIIQFLTPPLTTFEMLAFQLSFVAFTEELLFRNSLPRYFTELFYRYFKVPENVALGVSFAISSTLFGLVHFAAYQLNPVQIGLAFFAGGVFSVFRIWKKDDGGVWTCVVGHLIYNVLNMIGIFPTGGGGDFFTIGLPF